MRRSLTVAAAGRAALLGISIAAALACRSAPSTPAPLRFEVVERLAAPREAIDLDDPTALLSLASRRWGVAGNAFSEWTRVPSTILAYSGVAAAGVMQGRNAAAAPATNRSSSRIVVSQFVYPEAVAAASRAETRALIDYPWKVIVRETGNTTHALELYQLERDPGEPTDLAAVERDRAQRLASILNGFVREQMAQRRTLALASSTQSPPSAERLRALGYVK